MRGFLLRGRNESSIHFHFGYINNVIPAKAGIQGLKWALPASGYRLSPV